MDPARPLRELFQDEGSAQEPPSPATAANVVSVAPAQGPAAALAHAAPEAAARPPKAAQPAHSDATVASATFGISGRPVLGIAMKPHRN